MDKEIQMADLLKKSEVLKLINNYYHAPPSSRKTLLDNIVLAIRCMPAWERERMKEPVDSEASCAVMIGEGAMD